MRRVRLLVSVRNRAEALAALTGGADIIDVKEPARGSLGMADAATIADITAAVDGRRPVSAALGDLCDARPSAVPASLNWIKVGLRGDRADWRQQLAKRCAGAWPDDAWRARIVPVAYAAFDAHEQQAMAPESAEAVIAWAAAHHAAGVLIDTARKPSSHADATLMHTLMGRRGELATLVAAARAAGVMIGLAGSLHDRSFDDALGLGPDIIGVRGAACVKGQRDGAVCSARVAALAERVQAHNAQQVAMASTAVA